MASRKESLREKLLEVFWLALTAFPITPEWEKLSQSDCRECLKCSKNKIRSFLRKRGEVEDLQRKWKWYRDKKKSISFLKYSILKEISNWSLFCVFLAISKYKLLCHTAGLLETADFFICHFPGVCNSEDEAHVKELFLLWNYRRPAKRAIRPESIARAFILPKL